MMTEVLVYVPAVANFRLSWLGDRLAAARTAALVLQAAPDRHRAGEPCARTARQRRRQGGGDQDGPAAPPAGAVANAPAGRPRRRPARRDLDGRRCSTPSTRCSRTRTTRSAWSARRRCGGDFIEIVLDEQPLRDAMLRFSGNVLLLSLFISTVTAALVFLALHYLFVRPMRRITAEMVAFRRDPENSARDACRARRADEIGIAERELAGDAERSRLDAASEEPARGARARRLEDQPRPAQPAGVGAADLGQLARSADPNVQRFAPKLMRTLERAIDFCQSTLSYGRAQEPPPERRMVALEPLVEEVRESARPGGGERRSAGSPRSSAGCTIDADPDQLFRVLHQSRPQRHAGAGARATPNDPARDQIRITGRREGAVAVIEVSDTGPGRADKAREHCSRRSGFDARRRHRPRPRDRGRTRARAWRRHPPGRRNDRRDVPHHDSGSRRRVCRAPRTARAGVGHAERASAPSIMSTVFSRP